LLTVVNDTAEAENILEAQVRLPQGVVYRSFVKETVILNLETGLYHGLNPTGGHMLTTLEKVATVREAAVRLASDYGIPQEQIEADLIEFCSALIERGLLQVQ
jgi:hypothetical protein